MTAEETPADLLIRLLEGKSASRWPRIDGLDIARGLAFAGMVLVNYSIVMAGFGGGGPEWVGAMRDACTGRAAALFVLLAGCGMSLMLSRADARGGKAATARARSTYLRRSIALLVMGYAFCVIWSADILHYYAFYLVLGALLSVLASRWLGAIALLCVVGFVVIYLWWIPYFTGWNIRTLEHHDFWTWLGQLRNLFYNGWHPLLPWFAFFLVGMIIGRWPLQRFVFSPLLLLVGAALAVGARFGADALTDALADSDLPRYQTEKWLGLFGKECIPPGPFYVLEATGTALAVIGMSLFIARLPRWLWLPIARTGRMALTLYVAHVVIGLELWEQLGGDTDRADMPEVFRWWLFSVIASLVFATAWLQFRRRGPLEGLQRWICG